MKGLNSAFSNPLQFCLITLFAICYEQSAYSDFCEDTYKVLIESQQTKIHCQNFSLLFPPKIIPGLITQVLFCCSTAEQIAQTASYILPSDPLPTRSLCTVCWLQTVCAPIQQELSMSFPIFLLNSLVSSSSHCKGTSWSSRGPFACSCDPVSLFLSDKNNTTFWSLCFCIIKLITPTLE